MTANVSSQNQIGTLADEVATESFLVVNQAFEHTARAAEIAAGIQPLTPGDIQQITLAGPFGFACPAFGKLVMNSVRRMLSGMHTLAAQSLLGE